MGTAEKPDSDGQRIVCPGCLLAAPESSIRILPYFDDQVNGYVVLYRCEQCWLPYLEKTRARITTTGDWAEVASLIAFFEHHGVFELEFRRGDPLPVVRALLGRMIDLVGAGAIRLSARSSEPANEAEANASAMKENEKLAEAAYDAMYRSSFPTAKDCFDDARSYFAKAIEIANRAGLEDEVVRLTARRDHIVSVYNTQFRGVR